MLRTAREALLTVPEVRTTVSKAGQPVCGPEPEKKSMAEVFVEIKAAEHIP